MTIKLRELIVENLLLVATLSGVLIGFGLGLGLRPLHLNDENIELIGFPGEIFMNIIKLLTVPLIVSSLIAGLSSMNIGASGRIALFTICYYIISFILAATNGIGLMMLVQPGSPEPLIPLAIGPSQLHATTARPMQPSGQQRATTNERRTRDAVMDLLRNLFPENLVGAWLHQTGSEYKLRANAPATSHSAPFSSSSSLFTSLSSAWSHTNFNSAPGAHKSGGPTSPAPSTIFQAASSPPTQATQSSSEPVTAFSSGLKTLPAASSVEGAQWTSSPILSGQTGNWEWERSPVQRPIPDLLGLVALSVFAGVMLSRLGESGKALREVVVAANELVMSMIKAVMMLAPVGLASLIAGELLEVEDLAATVSRLVLFIGCLLVSLALHVLLVLPLLYLAVARKNPLRYMRGLLPAFFTTLGTDSSTATLPVTFKCLEDNLGIDRRVTRFVLPIGANMNMDGPALYEAPAAIFIAQVYGYQLSPLQIIIITIMATLVSFGAGPIPNVGVITMTAVLSSVGLPLDGLLFISAIDWIMDRTRTAVMVTGDGYGAGIVGSLVQRQLAHMDAKEALKKSSAGVDENGKTSLSGSRGKGHLHENCKESSVYDNGETDSWGDGAHDDRLAVRDRQVVHADDYSHATPGAGNSPLYLAIDGPEEVIGSNEPSPLPPPMLESFSNAYNSNFQTGLADSSGHRRDGAHDYLPQGEILQQPEKLQRTAAPIKPSRKSRQSSGDKQMSIRSAKNEAETGIANRCERDLDTREELLNEQP